MGKVHPLLIYTTLMAAAYLAAIFFCRYVPFFARARGPADRYQALDGLRGILALGVFVHHFAISAQYFETGRWLRPSSYFLARLGPVPVLLFFVLSGFVFWNRLISSNNVSWPRFFADRARRIYPAYLLCFAGVLVVAMARTGAHVANPAEFAYEVFKWLIFGLPDGDFPNLNGYGGTSVVNAYVFWTLPYEWLFYLSLPALVWFRKGARIFGLFAVLTALYFVLRRLLDGPQLQYGYAQTSLKFLNYLVSAFGAGMFTAWLRRRYATLRVPALPTLACGVAGLTVLMAVPIFPGSSAGLIVDRTLVFVVFAGVVFGNDFGGILTSKPTQFLGQVSYSIYVLHGVVLFITGAWVKSALGAFPAADTAVYLGMLQSLLVVACAAVSYRFIEYPFLKRKRVIDCAHNESYTTLKRRAFKA